MPFCSETCIAFVRSQSAIVSAELAAQAPGKHLEATVLDQAWTNRNYRLPRNWYIESIEGFAHRTDKDVIRSRLTSAFTCRPAPYLDTSDLAVAASFPGPSSCLRFGTGASGGDVQLNRHGVVVTFEKVNIA